MHLPRKLRTGGGVVNNHHAAAPRKTSQHPLLAAHDLLDIGIAPHAQANKIHPLHRFRGRGGPCATLMGAGPIFSLGCGAIINHHLMAGLVQMSRHGKSHHP
jgi:hypothetical protein